MIALALAVLFMTATPQDSPSACEIAPGVETDWAACVRDLPEGSPQQHLARLNLASTAYLNRDYATAERVYDEAGDFGSFASDALYAFRADTRRQVGREKDAVADARSSWRL